MSRHGLSIIVAGGVFATTLLATAARADTVTDWNEIALGATSIAGLAPPPQSRVMALVHAAIYDAVNSVDRGHRPYLVDIKAAAGASPEAAAAVAAHDMLARLFPQQQATLDASLEKSLGTIPDTTSKADGATVGREVAETLFTARLRDGFDAKLSYRGHGGPSAWQPTAPAKALPVLPHWGRVTPFLLTSATQFGLPPPPPAGSADFARDIEEVKRLGGWTTAARTPEQTAIAVFWAGSEIPPWNAVARSAANAHRNNLAANARLFAYLNMAMADSLIAGFAYKYQYDHWRPITAIQTLGLAATPGSTSDLAWRPLLVTPPHPEYPSAHCLASGAAATVLRTFLGSDTVDVSAISPPLGVLRTWKNYTEIVKEVEDARVWGGIHFRAADEQGTHLGERIAAYGLSVALLPMSVTSR